MSKLTINDLAMSFDDNRILHEKFLRQHGWEHSSNYPDSIWRWSRKLPDGRVVATQMQDAVSLTEYLDADAYEPENENEIG